jgi:glycosyltransferase involved in cell wall biosynthesis
MDGLEWMRTKYSKPAQQFLRLAEKLAAKHAGILVADSSYMKEYLLEKYNRKAVYIPYGAEEFVSTDLSVFRKHQVNPGEYFLLIARMEPENNIDMIIKGYLLSKHPYPLLVVGDTTNAYGKKIRAAYPDSSIHFCGSIYDQAELNNLRYHSAKYFHGHSVGGTNPSLLEAMSCRCDIVAHKNSFNKAILREDANYFSSANDVAAVINMRESSKAVHKRKQSNIGKIKTVYSQQKNIDDYEQLMFVAANRQKQPQPVAYAFSRLISN